MFPTSFSSYRGGYPDLPGEAASDPVHGRGRTVAHRSRQNTAHFFHTNFADFCAFLLKYAD